jgi:hypothetical protein
LNEISSLSIFEFAPSSPLLNKKNRTIGKEQYEKIKRKKGKNNRKIGKEQ